MIRKFLLAAAFLALAQDGAGEGVVSSTVTLAEAVREALEKSPVAAAARLEAEAAGLEEPLFLANTDPRFQAAYLWTDDQAPRANPAFQGTFSRRRNFDAAVVGKTLLGTEARLAWRTEWLRSPAPFRVLDPSVESRLSLEVRQPLLKRFWGRPDRALRSQARAGVRAARGNLDDVRAEVAAAAARDSMALHVARENAAVARAAARAARRLVALYEEKRRYGLVEESGLLQARASLEAADIELAQALSLEETARNALAAAMQRHGTEAAAPVTAEEWPDFEAGSGGDEGTPGAVLERRGDVRAARAAVEAAEWGMRLEILDSLPDLAAQGSYGAAGLDKTHSGAWKELNGFDHPVKSAGISLAVPFGGRTERLNREAGRIQLETYRRREARVVQQALREMRDADERLRLARERLAATERLAALEGKKLAAEERNFRRGRSDTDLLIRFQQDLYRAQSRLLRARADEILARVEWSRAAGAWPDAPGPER
ncbi:MAG: TolC family protein [Elusimicrobiota bacterium]